MAPDDQRDLEAPVADILRALTEIRETMPRCGGCQNFLEVVARVRADLDGLDADAAAPARQRLAAWLDEAASRVKTTNHCEVCVPSGPYERFATALGRAGDTQDPR